ncbi:ROK family protein [Actinospica sp. MGRD01-02]|uniref:ROK family protein n=1 Tax=Actinospica acidithermotolerans TaxID=2828514 RepID=A0A941E729_9ACTN|nr:ROK family protein [Actinospica acidithermotolerans]MBR7825138.1 ROK family protein [Actinospica acidithermotolerans]
MPENPLAAGVDVGGTSIKCVLTAPDGRIVAGLRSPTPRRGADIGERLTDAIATCVATLSEQAPGPVSAVGLAVPGVVADADGLAMRSENLGWSDLPLRDMVAERLSLPTAFGHDVRVGGLAEARLGSGRTLRSVVFVPIGTGIAAALILDGRPYSAGGYAGEIGHTDVGHGEPCVCGATGCLEAIASAAAIARRYTRRSGRPVAGAEEVVALAGAGDSSALTTWNEALDALAGALAWVASVLAPEAVILGGGLAEAGDALMTPVAERLTANLSFQRRPRLLRAALGDRAASLGSALLAHELLAETCAR